MSVRTWICVFTVVCACSLSCSDSHDNADSQGGAPTDRNPIQYPYVADASRQSEILENYMRIEPGMTSVEVREILGNPDEVLPLYEPVMKNPRRIGSTYFYIMERPEENAPWSRRREILVRMDMEETVTEIVAEGIERGHTGSETNGVH